MDLMIVRVFSNWDNSMILFSRLQTALGFLQLLDAAPAVLLLVVVASRPARAGRQAVGSSCAMVISTN